MTVEGKSMKRIRMVMLAAAPAAMLLAACGGGDSSTSSSAGAGAAPSSDTSGTSGTATGEATPTAASTPEATPAALSGTYTGTFSNVADAPKGTGTIGGTATMKVSASGTVVSIAATGLDPKNTYIAHVHNKSCSENEGGDHFKFDPAGPSKPPNEIWLTPVTVTGKDGKAKATSTKKVNSSAKSVVLHLKRAAGSTTDEAKPPKLACADLAKK